MCKTRHDFSWKGISKRGQGAMVSFKGVSCHGSSPVGHGPSQELHNCSGLFSLARSKDDSFAAMLILEIAPRGISVHQGRVLLPQQGGHTPKTPWGGSPETRDEFV